MLPRHREGARSRDGSRASDSNRAWPTRSRGTPRTMGDFPILVTGAAGFVGGHLLDLLEESGDRVVAWRRPGRGAPLAADGHALPVGRGGHPRCSRRARGVAGVRPRLVYHLAGAAHAGQSWDRAAVTLQVNVLGTHNLLAALAAAGGPRARVDPGVGARLRASGSGPERVGPAGTAQSLCLEQARPGDVRGLLPAGGGGIGPSSRVRSTTSGLVRTLPSSRPASPCRSRGSSRAGGSRYCAWGTWTRAATSPTSATPCVPTPP